MKIGILVDEIAPGSAPKILGQTVQGLSSLGHSCEALVIVERDYYKEFSEIYNFHLKGVKIRYLLNEVSNFLKVFKKIDFKFPGFSFFSIHHILSFLLAPNVIKNREYDIIIAHCQYSTFAARSLKKFRKIPYLLLVWDPSPYTLKKIYSKTWLRIFYPFLYVAALLLDKFAISGAEALITSGKLHHKRFRKISNKPLEDLYPGCFPNKEFIPYAKREKAILTYDRWDIGNKPHIFLDLLENIDQDIKLKIGGFWHPEGIKYDFLKEIKTRNLETRIELLGPLDEKRILEVCSQVMLHVHPNEEAFGMQTLEAAGCGCCIIIPRGSGVTDLFAHGVHGYFPEKGNFQELLKYVKLVFSNINNSEKMGRRAWEIAGNYTWSGYIKRLKEIIGRYVDED
ncbi:MAG: hypothetical protein DRP68_02195 [Candidatus Omnitrophota bacterium]|nr:MAG: hypothetical protein DRP68_02195 [Candidatus Omnitrophota bacterium]RKY38796.1 MAG: hypothetical protein DRP72_01160 [Candidatus Omnitrophota bacterium]